MKPIKAKDLLELDKNLEVVKPLKDGVIANFNAAENMIRGMIGLINKSNKFLFPPTFKMVICIPSGITEVELRAVVDSAERAGGKEVKLI
jgi:rod shape-determining protein MreB